MEKNQFLIYNDLIDHLYNCTGMEELKKDFMVYVLQHSAVGGGDRFLVTGTGRESLSAGAGLCAGHICGSGETVYSEGGTGSGAVVDPWQ